MSSRENTYSTTRHQTYTAQKQFKAVDHSIPYRLVGTYEYGIAIDSLTKLAESSTDEQIAVYDKLIREKPEFSFHSGFDTAGNANLLLTVNVNVDPDTQTTEEREAQLELLAQQQQSPEKKFERHSLAWMLALARVEVGATNSMYGDSLHPFAEPGSRSFGIKEFAQLMLDDSATHITRMKVDSQFEANLGKREDVDSDTLAYLRRIKIVGDMLNALSEIPDERLNAELRPYVEQNESYANRLSAKIEIVTARYQTEEIETSEYGETEERYHHIRFRNRDFLLGCQRLLEARTNNRGR